MLVPVLVHTILMYSSFMVPLGTSTFVPGARSVTYQVHTAVPYQYTYCGHVFFYILWYHTAALAGPARVRGRPGMRFPYQGATPTEKGSILHTSSGSRDTRHEMVALSLFFQKSDLFHCSLFSTKIRKFKIHEIFVRSPKTNPRRDRRDTPAQVASRLLCHQTS